MTTERPAINPTAEEAHWRLAFRQEPYYHPAYSYADYSPAYRVGYTGPLRRSGSFAALEAQLQRDWLQVRGRSRLAWPQARQAMQAAWNRVVHASQEAAEPA
jgi:hypothetical protein